MSKLRAGVYASLLLFTLFSTSMLFIIFDPKITTLLICSVGCAIYLWRSFYTSFTEKEKE